MHLQCTMSSSIGKNVDWACANALKHGTITVSGFGYFHKNCRFLWGKNVSKTNLGTTIQYTYTSYNKYFRLCMVSEELRLNEIGLFLQQYRFNHEQQCKHTVYFPLPLRKYISHIYILCRLYFCLKSQCIFVYRTDIRL